MAGLVPYPVVAAKLDLRQGIFKDNLKSWDAVIQRFDDALESVSSEGDARSQRLHHAKGQLLGPHPLILFSYVQIQFARDRIALLLDSDSPFLELAPFAGFELNSTPAASLIAGIGKVSGQACMILSHVPSIKGGSWNEYTILKHNRVSQIATENRLPIIGLAQAAGAYLPQQFRVFHRAGEMFRDLARRSQKGLPSCSVVFGSSTAGGAYLPGLSDYTIFVQKQAQVFLGGPPLVKMATGEVIDAETLGGADMHASVTGLADQVAADEFDAIRKAREWVSSLPSQRIMAPDRGLVLEPRYPSEDVLSLVNTDIRKPFDMTEVVLRLVDDSRMATFKPSYGKNILTAWAEIHGFRVGIIGNQTPVIHPDEACKGAQFIRLCNQRNMPIIYLHNVTGFMVGSKAEREAIIKKGAQFVAAVSCSQVPQISVILGSSYGAGNYAMCGRAYQPRFMFTWPSGRCSVMGPDQLAGVMDIVQTGSATKKEKEKERERAARQNGTTASTASDAKPRTASLKPSTASFRDKVEQESQAFYTSAMLLDDGIIDPRDTRDVLGMCLNVVHLEELKGAASQMGLARL